MYKIDLKEQERKLEGFVLDFYFLKISGKADINARKLFKAITEFDSFGAINPFFEIIPAMNSEAKAEIDVINQIYNDKMSLIDDNEKDKINEVKEEWFGLMEQKIREYMIKNDFPTIQTIDNRFIKALVNEKATNIISLYSDLIKQAVLNKSISVELNDQTNKEFVESGGFDVNEKQFIELSQRMGSCYSILDMADTVFEFYKKEYINIYNSLKNSINDFLLVFK